MMDKMNIKRGWSWPVLVAALLFAVTTGRAFAVPAFARQTGQNCVACHAGGQFPELTAYGRLFKLTGYTLGARTLPLSVMAVLGYSKTASPSEGGIDPSSAPTFTRDGKLALQGASLFLAGKVIDNVGVMGQWTYSDDGSSGHSNVDNTEVRYADRFVGPAKDFIVGAFLNNNPTMQDVWNSTPAWGYPYLQSSFAAMPGAAPLLAGGAPPIMGGLAQQSVGVGAYVQWNQTLYAELSMYDNAKGPVSFLRAGDLATRFSKPAPYWRLAWSHDWGPHNLMVGTNGLVATLHDDPTDSSSPTSRFRDIGIDSQYQYILDPHTVTVHLSYIREKQSWGSDQVAAGVNSSDTLSQFKLKGSYTYQAKYGGSLAYIRGHGSADPGLYSAAGDPTDPTVGNANSSPNYSVWVPELYWMPIQYVRLGLQYWRYGQFNGATSNYNGLGRDAKDNNFVFLYAWLVY